MQEPPTVADRVCALGKGLILLGTGGVMLLMAGGLATCSYKALTASETPAVERWAPKPEATVQAKKGAMACLSLDATKIAMAHAAAGEATKLQAMVPVPCMLVPLSERYKVLALDGQYAEITHVQSGRPDGMWTLAEWLVPPGGQQ